MQQQTFFDTDIHVHEIALVSGYKPEEHDKLLATIGDDRPPVSLVGFRIPLALKHLQWHCEQSPPRQANHRDRRICTVDCMARSMYQVSDSKNRQRVRKQAGKMVNQCIEWGLFLCLKYEPRGSGTRHRIVSMKLAQRGDHFSADEQLRRMRDRRELTDAKARQAAAILRSLELASNELPDA